MKLVNLQPITAAIAACDGPAALAAIDAALQGETGRDWNRHLGTLRDVITDGAARFKIFAKDGNVKLPFLAFSSLPGVGFCPGAGECLKFCYSFKAHRYPAAYARQAQNSWLIRQHAGRIQIAAALDRFDKGAQVDFRLYVDGDFQNLGVARFWMETIRVRPWLNAYGYSKSFEVLLRLDKHYRIMGKEWPDNYRLNLSSGHKYGLEVIAAMRQLPITRGDFVAVSIGSKVRSSDHGTKVHNAKLRAAYDGKAFTCPGRCGTCTPKGHACGSKRFDGIAIIIAVH